MYILDNGYPITRAEDLAELLAPDLYNAVCDLITDTEESACAAYEAAENENTAELNRLTAKLNVRLAELESAEKAVQEMREKVAILENENQRLRGLLPAIPEEVDAVPLF